MTLTQLTELRDNLHTRVDWDRVSTAPSRAEMEQRRVEGCRLLREGLSQAEVARRLGVSRTTTGRWALLLSWGASLAARKPSGRPSRITRQQEQVVIRSWCEGPQPGRTSRDFASLIERVTGIRYNPDHAGRIMHRIGLREKRNG